MSDDTHTRRNRHQESLFQRHAGNPMLTAAHWPYSANSVFNAASARLTDGQTLLLCRVEDHRGHSHFGVARSADGITDWQVHPKPVMVPEPDRYPEELWGIEDPRITYIPDLRQYAVVYTSYSRGGPGVSLALTRDFLTFERLGVTMSPEDKDAALLPYKIKGRWAMIHRPVTGLGAHIWISYSPDMRHWGDHRLILEARRGGWWDANKIGLSPPLIETAEGWLMIYHGVRQTAGGCLYRLGLALFDLENPERVRYRGENWVFGPEEMYEREGDVDNVVFPCGCTMADDGDTLRMYYGAADTSICLATASIKQLLDWLRRDARHAVTIPNDLPRP